MFQVLANSGFQSRSKRSQSDLKTVTKIVILRSVLKPILSSTLKPPCSAKYARSVRPLDCERESISSDEGASRAVGTVDADGAGGFEDGFEGGFEVGGLIKMTVLTKNYGRLNAVLTILFRSFSDHFYIVLIYSETPYLQDFDGPRKTAQ